MFIMHANIIQLGYRFKVSLHLHVRVISLAHYSASKGNHFELYHGVLAFYSISVKATTSQELPVSQNEGAGLSINILAPQNLICLLRLLMLLRQPIYIVPHTVL